jgi:hypothetical protein
MTTGTSGTTGARRSDERPVAEPTYYPDMPCHAAQLRPGEAPLLGCECRICDWARSRSRHDSLLDAITGPILPGTPAWDALMEVAL